MSVVQDTLTGIEVERVPRPAYVHCADVIRYDGTIVYPAPGFSCTPHVRLESHDGKAYWVLTNIGRKLFSEQIERIGVYAENHPDLRQLALDNPKANMRLPKDPTAITFQIVNLSLAHRDYGFTREDLEAFNQAMVAHYIPVSSDVVQAARHVSQWGLARVDSATTGSGTRVYTLPDTLSLDPGMRLVKEEAEEVSKEDMVARVKEYYKREYLDVPVEKWDWGHTRPGGTTLTVQPRRVNRSSTDRYIFGPYGERLLPAPKYLLDKMEKHYTDEDMLAIHAELGKRIMAKAADKE